MSKIITTKEFIENSKKVHGDKYDYSLSNYIDAHKKIKIICKEHGIFEQPSNSHISAKSGCPYCSKTFQLTTEVFIEKSIIKHNNKYDYSKTEYINAKTKINIICKEHGNFTQTPNSHLNGTGCPKCGIKTLAKKQTISNQDFIDKSNKIHNNKYDYSLVDYKNCKIKIKIICKDHGMFEQLPDHHSRGVGCPTCSKYYGSFNDKYLYIFYDYKFNLMKIGASKDPEKRLKEISKGKDKSGLKILKIYEKSANIEKNLHIKYDKYRTNHILYEDGGSEWFNLPENEIIEIDKIISRK